MGLCTVTNQKFLKNAINLINSYRINFDKKDDCFIYCFDMSEDEIYLYQNIYKSIIFKFIPKVVDHAYDPTAFFYKVYAINDCINNTDFLIYSDATNVFNKFTNIKNYMIDDTLFLPYSDVKLTNQYWTTNKCFEKIDCNSAKIMPQYWAGFQVYKSTEENRKFIGQYYNFMKDPDVALPNTSIKKPDGENSLCIEHRQDQSVLSILIHKYFRDQKFNYEKQQLFGDWQTFKNFNLNYQHDLENCCLSSRESKFGYYRFL
jgi:hypothetical protein